MQITTWLPCRKSCSASASVGNCIFLDFFASRYICFTSKLFEQTQYSLQMKNSPFSHAYRLPVIRISIVIHTWYNISKGVPAHIARRSLQHAEKAPTKGVCSVYDMSKGNHSAGQNVLCHSILKNCRKKKRNPLNMSLELVPLGISGTRNECKIA